MTSVVLSQARTLSEPFSDLLTTFHEPFYDLLPTLHELSENPCGGLSLKMLTVLMWLCSWFSTVWAQEDMIPTAADLPITYVSKLLHRAPDATGASASTLDILPAFDRDAVTDRSVPSRVRR